MSGLGQNRKNSMRANVFRCSPNNGHRQDTSACPLRATTGYMRRSGTALLPAQGSGSFAGRIRHCEERWRRSNPHLFGGKLDCFAEPVIGPRFAKRVELRTPLRPWQRELKSRAPSRAGARPQPAAMRFDDPPTDRQSHAGALRLGGEECLENALAFVTGSPVPESLTEINN